MIAPEDTGREFERIDGRRVLAAIPIAVAVAFLVWFLVHGEGERSLGMGPMAVTAAELHELAGERGTPIYWLGEQPGAVAEMTETDEGNVTIRYLPLGTEIGDPRTDFLSIGTYPVIGGGYTATKEAAKAEGAVSRRVRDGALVVTNEGRPTNVYVGRRRSPVQVEVYDPDPERAMSIATSGDLQPVE